MNKLEKVALKCVKRRKKPLVLVINNVHYFNNDEAGRSMLLQLQQRAEAWAASGKSMIRTFHCGVNRRTCHRNNDHGIQHVSHLV